MRAVRFVYLLALTLWLGGMVVLGTIVAPATFGTLQGLQGVAGRVLAGAVFGDVLFRFHHLAYGCGALMLASLGATAWLARPRPARLGWRSALVVAMFGVALYSGLVVLGEVEAIRRDVNGPMEQLREHDRRRDRFNALHARSTNLMSLNVVLGLLLVALESRT